MLLEKIKDIRTTLQRRFENAAHLKESRLLVASEQG